MLDLLVDQKYFTAISNGKKTAEGRINSPKFKTLKVGDLICFTNSQDHSKKQSAVIIALHCYADFKTMLKKEGLENMLPGLKSIEVGVSVYESFHGYKQAVQKDGAIAIRFKLN